MKRLHVHVSVDNLAESIGFYSALFANEPTVQKEDYAKWMLEDPRVNFAISKRGMQTGLNHLGIQVDSDNELNDMHTRLDSVQPGVEKDAGAACCYAKSDKYWITDPQGIAWETFHTLDSIPVFGDDSHQNQALEKSASPCCIPLATPKEAANATCCVPSAGAQPPTSGKCC